MELKYSLITFREGNWQCENTNITNIALMVYCHFCTTESVLHFFKLSCQVYNISGYHTTSIM